MYNIQAAQILRERLSGITDSEYKTATEIAIETLYSEALSDYLKLESMGVAKGTALEYLQLTPEEYERWVAREQTRK